MLDGQQASKKELDCLMEYDTTTRETFGIRHLGCYSILPRKIQVQARLHWDAGGLGLGTCTSSIVVSGIAAARLRWPWPAKRGRVCIPDAMLDGGSAPLAFSP